MINWLKRYYKDLFNSDYENVYKMMWERSIPLDLTDKAVKDQIERLSEQFRKAKAMDEEYNEMQVNNRNLTLGLISVSDYCKEQCRILNRYKHSPERKEMELLSGRKYENKELKDNFVFVTGFYGNKVFFTNVFSSEKIALTHEQFRLIYKEWHEPRTLKLEDLNKFWVQKNLKTLYVIRLDNNGRVIAISFGITDRNVIKTLKEFFEDFREATQADIDNLTKGE